MRFFLIALVLLTGVEAASAKPAAAPAKKLPTVVAEPAKPADWDLRVERGIALARSVQPEDEVIAFALRQMDENLVGMLSSSPQIKEIEGQFPGFSQRYYAAGRPVLDRLLRSRLPSLWKAMGEVYATQMTPDQIDSAATFYRSPLGQKMLRSVNENLNAKSLLQSSLRQGLEGRSDSAEAREELESATGKAVLSSITSLSAPERSLLIKFMVSPAGKGLRRAGPAVTEAVSNWMIADDPDAEAEMAEVAMTVLTQMKAAKDGPAK